MSKILALDLSLCRSGVARLTEVVAGQPRVETETVTVPPLRVCGARPGTERNQARVGPERLLWWRQWLIEEIARGVDVVAIEAMAGITQQKGRHVLDTAKLFGVIDLTCFEREVEVVQIAPSAIKKFATGHGRAEKDAMQRGAVERFGEGIRDEHQADAAWLGLFVWKQLSE